ncbi:MAG TPA: hypothetical protein VN634_02855 [Candidatus Limnocylindrales bacterium]|nr:hypothetical protein [Candidatus Limnocylindrales bacterium]
MQTMKMFTHAELRELRERARREPEMLVGNPDLPDLLDRLIGQAEYGLDCARLLEEAVHYPAEPYGEAEVLVARLTNGRNDIWNRHHYRESQGRPAK